MISHTQHSLPNVLPSLTAQKERRADPQTVDRPARGKSKSECVLFLRQRELKDRVNPRSPGVGALVVTTLKEEEVQAVMSSFLRSLRRREGEGGVLDRDGIPRSGVSVVSSPRQVTRSLAISTREPASIRSEDERCRHALRLRELLGLDRQRIRLLFEGYWDISSQPLQDEGLLSLVSDELDIRRLLLALVSSDVGQRVIAEHRIVAERTIRLYQAEALTVEVTQLQREVGLALEDVCTLDREEELLTLDLEGRPFRQALDLDLTGTDVPDERDLDGAALTLNGVGRLQIGDVAVGTELGDGYLLGLIASREGDEARASRGLSEGCDGEGNLRTLGSAKGDPAGLRLRGEASFGERDRPRTTCSSEVVLRGEDT